MCTSGTLEECPNPPNTDVVFTACNYPTLSGSLLIDGTLTYTPTGDWPSGVRMVEVMGTSFGNSQYTIMLDGTSSVTIFFEDLDSGTQATCDGD